MMERLLGEHTELVISILKFIIGEGHKAMAFAYILMTINMIAVSFKEKKLNFIGSIEKVFAYSAFMIIGNIVDALAMDAMFGWEGSTQFFICVYIVMKEIVVIKNYLTARFGIDIPILNQRIEQVQQHVGGAEADPIESVEPLPLEERIETLRQELEALESQQEEEIQ